MKSHIVRSRGDAQCWSVGVNSLLKQAESSSARCASPEGEGMATQCCIVVQKPVLLSQLTRRRRTTSPIVGKTAATSKIQPVEGCLLKKSNVKIGNKRGEWGGGGNRKPIEEGRTREITN